MEKKTAIISLAILKTVLKVLPMNSSEENEVCSGHEDIDVCRTEQREIARLFELIENLLEEDMDLEYCVRNYISAQAGG